LLNPIPQRRIGGSLIQKVSNLIETRHPYPIGEQVLAGVHHLEKKGIIVFESGKREIVPPLRSGSLHGE
jgi:hypothetical protein